MGWGYGSAYRNSGIRMLRDYAEALNKFETTTPIRNPKRTVECRPLGHRDRPHFSIGKLTDGSIACYDYNTTHKSVVFHPDNTVTVNPTWVSTSTCAFIQELLGISATQHDHSVKLMIGGSWIRIPKDGMVIKRKDGGGAYELVTQVKEVVHHVKRKEANNVRLKYQSFRDYLSGMLKLRGDKSDLPDEEIKAVFGVEHRTYEMGGKEVTYEYSIRPKLDYSDPINLETFFALVESSEPSDMYKAMMTVVLTASRWRIMEQATLEVFDRCILARHKDEVFKEVEVVSGALTKDRYGWAFK